jgi:hypothetical protein
MLKTVERQFESYLFEGTEGKFRAIPFYELSIMELVIFEDKEPKYILDLDRRDQPLVMDIRKRLETGIPPEEIIEQLGRFLGREWTTHHNLPSPEVIGSQESENVKLLYLDDLSDLFIDLTFVAFDELNLPALLNETLLFQTYLTEDGIGLGSSWIDTYDNLKLLIKFLFNSEHDLVELASDGEKKILDLSHIKNDCISLEELDKVYDSWIYESQRSNNMDEYGYLVGIIGYILENIDKTHLILISQKRAHY